MSEHHHTAAPTPGPFPSERAVEIVVNAEMVVTRALTLEDLIVEQGHSAVRVATALNGSFVPARSRATTNLQAGDRIEILTARQGG